MAPPKITEPPLELVVDGLAEHDGIIDMRALAAQLQRLYDVLKAFDAIRNDGAKAEIRYGVSDIKRESPARISIVPLHGGESDDRPPPGSDFSAFMNAVDEALSAKQTPKWASESFLKRLEGLAKPVGNSIGTFDIHFDDRCIHLDKEVAIRIRSILPANRFSIGSVKGHIEKMNVHDLNRTFSIYPLTGAKSISCKFEKHLRQQAIDAMGNLARVHGRLTYTQDSLFPVEMNVTAIEVLEDLDNAASFMDLRGVAPELPDGLSSVEFVRNLRNEW